jgi:hypothetical protein
MRIRKRLLVNRNADAERFKAGIGTQMRKIKDAKYRNAKKERLKGRQGIENSAAEEKSTKVDTDIFNVVSF